MIEARNNGVPLIEQAPKAAITQSIVQLSKVLTNDGKIEALEGEGKKFGLGSLLKFWPIRSGK